ncbi:fibronectin type III domain-containing protein [Marinitoga sp. 1138]|uniref:fibronectin type III domain-containing protein n=1 Tax=Marinitoga sp. 1138 TaxID=1643334 RepID=UPI0015869AF7|nr:fibronectin type III domain-containing protein [Marinitoga sp. 1138]NUU97357.1 hypothetical protein [Marinitoga sp. 1138]
MGKIFKKKILYIFLIVVILFLLNGCFFVKPPKAILDYPSQRDNLPTSFLLSWHLEGNASSDEFTFEVYYGKSKDNFTGTISTQNTSINIEGLEDNSTYYFKIRTVKKGQFTDSDIYELKTSDIPKIEFLMEDNVIETTEYEVKWKVSDNNGIKKIMLYFSEDPDFPEDKTQINEFNASVNSFLLKNLDYGKTYYLKLVAYDTNDIWSYKTYEFSVKSYVFQIISPAPGSKSVNINNIKLQWKYSKPSKFEVVYSPNNSIDNNDVVRVSTSNSYYIIDNLPPGLEISWYVIDTVKNVESPIATFTTSYKPEIEITYPENNEVGVPEGFSITWKATDVDNDSLSFNIKIKKINESDILKYVDFDNGCIYETTTNQKSLDTSNIPLEKGMWYGILLKANDGKGNEVEERIKFRMNVDPQEPYDLKPESGTIDYPTKNATLSWKTYDPDGNLTFIVHPFEKSASSKDYDENKGVYYYVLNNLEYNKEYSWWVEAVDNTGASTISSVATFMTNAKPVFKDATPVNNENNISLLPELEWEFEDSNLSYYQVYLAKSSEDFTLIATVTDTKYKIEDLLDSDSKYKWKVIAYDTCGDFTDSGELYFETTKKPDISQMSPADGAHNISLKPILSWSAEDPDNNDEDMSYKVVVKDSEENVVLTEETTDTNISVNLLLQPDSEYKWYIEVEDSKFATNVSDEFSFTTSQEPTVSNLDPSGVEGVAASENLSWNASDPDGDSLLYYVYLNDTLEGTTTEKEYSLEEVKDLEPDTEYSWYVVAEDSKFATAVSDVATFITAQAPENSPDIIDIYDYYEPDKKYTFNESKYPSKLKLIWNPSSDPYNGSIKYRIVGEYLDEKEILADNLTSNSAIVEFKDGKTYTVYVEAINDKGMVLKGKSINLKINANPKVMDYSPRSDDNNVKLNPTIMWIAEDNDSSYVDVYIYYGKDENNLNNSVKIERQSMNGEYTITEDLDPGEKYYWKLKLEDEMYGVTETDIRSFTTTHAPVFKSITGITDGSTNEAVNDVEISWDFEDPDGDLLEYQIEVYKNGEGTPYYTKDLGTLNYIKLDFEVNTEYKFVITAEDNKSAKTTKEISFKTTRSPVIYNDSLYPDSTVNHFTNGSKFTWTAFDPDDDDLTYKIYLGESSNSLKYFGETENNELVVNNLDSNKTYYWKVKAIDSKGAEVESNVVSFKTNALPQFDKTAFSPQNNEVGINKNVTLKWKCSDSDAVSGELTYEIWFGDAIDSLLKLADQSLAYYNHSNLENGKTYYWKIIAKDKYGGETSSEILKFTVNRPPVTPEIENIDEDLLEFNLKWSSRDPENQSITYDVLKKEEGASDYSTVAYNISDTEYFMERLTPAKTYSFKVRAIDDKGDISESTYEYNTPTVDTNIYTKESGDSDKVEEILDMIELSDGNFVYLEKIDSSYELKKVDSNGNSIDTYNVNLSEPCKLFENTSNHIVVVGKDSNDKISFEEVASDLSGTTNPPATNPYSTTVDISEVQSIYINSDNKIDIVGTYNSDSILVEFNEDYSISIAATTISDTTLYDVIKITDEDGNERYIVAGSKSSKGYIAKLDNAFSEIIFEKEFDDMDKIVSIVDTDPDFWIFGYKDTNIVLKQISYRGNELYSPIIENSYGSENGNLLKSNNGFVILLNTTDGDIEVLKTDDSMNIEKQVIFGRTGEDVANGIIESSDGGYIIFGKTKSFDDKTNGNSYIIKTDSNLLGWSTPE